MSVVLIAVSLPYLTLRFMRAGSLSVFLTVSVTLNTVPGTVNNCKMNK